MLKVKSTSIRDNVRLLAIFVVLLFNSLIRCVTKSSGRSPKSRSWMNLIAGCVVVQKQDIVRYFSSGLYAVDAVRRYIHANYPVHRTAHNSFKLQHLDGFRERAGLNAVSPYVVIRQVCWHRAVRQRRVDPGPVETIGAGPHSHQRRSSRWLHRSYILCGSCQDRQRHIFRAEIPIRSVLLQ